VLAWTGLPSPELVTRPRVEERLAHALSLTLGDVAKRLEGTLPTGLADDIREAVDTRKFLARHLWFERAHLLFDVTNVQELIAELAEYAQVFDQLDARLSEWSQPMRHRLGLTSEALAESLEQVSAGETDGPLPDKREVRALEKKLSRPQRLLRVWEFALAEGGKPPHL
jgi:hypothetical protein